jgi:hypothetical protein
MPLPDLLSGSSQEVAFTEVRISNVKDPVWIAHEYLKKPYFDLVDLFSRKEILRSRNVSVEAGHSVLFQRWWVRIYRM